MYHQAFWKSPPLLPLFLLFFIWHNLHKNASLWSITHAEHKLQTLTAMFVQCTDGGGVKNLSVKFKYQNIFKGFLCSRLVVHRNHLTQAHNCNSRKPKIFLSFILFILLGESCTCRFLLTYTSVFQLVLYQKDCLTSSFDRFGGKTGHSVKTTHSFLCSPVHSPLLFVLICFRIANKPLFKIDNLSGMVSGSPRTLRDMVVPWLKEPFMSLG